MAGKFNGKLIDTTRAITEDGSIEIVTPDHEDALPILRHSAAHLFAQAARRLSQTFTWELVQPSKMVSTTILTTQLVKSLTKTFLVSKKKCKKIVKENFPSIREEVTKDEAREIFKMTLQVGID